MRSLLALVIIMFPPIALISPMFYQPSWSLEYSFDVPIDSLIICDSNVDLGYKDNVFDMLSANIDNFLSLGYFGGYDAPMIHIA